MGTDRLHEVVLPRRVKTQPTPNIHPGGDCGACVFGGIFDIPVERAYDEFKGKRDSIDFWEMSRMLRVAESHGIADRIIDRPVDFPPLNMGGGFTPFGMPGWFQAGEWHSHVQMAIDAGYYGLAQVDYSRKGLDGSGTDHWVAIVGARTGVKWTYEEREGMGRVGSGETIIDVLVSCSARPSAGKDEWVNATEFLRYRGGYNMLFARPAAR